MTLYVVRLPNDTGLSVDKIFFFIFFARSFSPEAFGLFFGDDLGVAPAFSLVSMSLSSSWTLSFFFFFFSFSFFFFFVLSSPSGGLTAANSPEIQIILFYMKLLKSFPYFDGWKINNILDLGNKIPIYSFLWNKSDYL